MLYPQTLGTRTLQWPIFGQRWVPNRWSFSRPRSIKICSRNCSHGPNIVPIILKSLNIYLFNSKETVNHLIFDPQKNVKKTLSCNHHCRNEFSWCPHWFLKPPCSSDWGADRATQILAEVFDVRCKPLNGCLGQGDNMWQRPSKHQNGMVFGPMDVKGWGVESSLGKETSTYSTNHGNMYCFRDN